MSQTRHLILNAGVGSRQQNIEKQKSSSDMGEN